MKVKEEIERGVERYDKSMNECIVLYLDHRGKTSYIESDLYMINYIAQLLLGSKIIENDGDRYIMSSYHVFS